MAAEVVAPTGLRAAQVAVEPTVATAQLAQLLKVIMVEMVTIAVLIQEVAAAVPVPLVLQVLVLLQVQEG